MSWPSSAGEREEEEEEEEEVEERGGGGLRKRPTASNGFPFIQFTPAFRSINAIADTAATAITSKPTPKMLHTDTHTHTRGGMDKKRNENAE